MECQDIYDQVEQVEWVRQDEGLTRAYLKYGNNEIIAYGKYVNKHHAMIAVMLAYCDKYPNDNLRQFKAWAETHIDKVVVE